MLERLKHAELLAMIESVFRDMGAPGIEHALEFERLVGEALKLVVYV